MDNIIFTDVDGVLNSGPDTTVRCKGYWGIEPERLDILKELAEKTGSKIVLSSTWRLGKEENDDFWRYLNIQFEREGIEIYDVTPDLRWWNRCLEILTWLSDNPAEHIVIFDDEDFYWDRHGLEKYWIDTSALSEMFHHGHYGLTEEHIQYVLDNYEGFLFDRSLLTEGTGKISKFLHEE